MTACDACLVRGWLLGRMAGHFDITRGDRARIREVMALDDADLIAGIGGAEHERLLEERSAVSARDLRAQLVALRLAAVCRHADEYPAMLRDLSDPPAVLYVAGDLDLLGEITLAREGAPAVAIVGARRASSSGLGAARRLGRGLSLAGVPVVSGMAMGIDAAAHRGALEGGARTVAVLGCGVDIPYPRVERALYVALREQAVLVSELPPGTPVRRWAFPARNRIIAALAAMTIVVEAAERSGSLITSEIAQDLGREVGAVPGRPDATGTRGTNGLLRDGGAVVRDVEDALDDLFGIGGRERMPRPLDAALLSPPLRELLAGVNAGQQTIDALCRTPQDVSRVMAGMAELEMLGYVRRTGEGRYVIEA